MRQPLRGPMLLSEMRGLACFRALPAQRTMRTFAVLVLSPSSRMRRTSARCSKTFLLAHSRNFLLKISTKLLAVGLSEQMAMSTPCFCAHVSNTRQILLRQRSSSTCTTRCPDSDISTFKAGFDQFQRSRMVRRRIHRPGTRLSLTKSMSPVHLAHEVQADMLVACGEIFLRCRRCNGNHSSRYRAALRRFIRPRFTTSFCAPRPRNTNFLMNHLGVGSPILLYLIL